MSTISQFLSEPIALLLNGSYSFSVFGSGSAFICNENNSFQYIISNGQYCTFNVNNEYVYLYPINSVTLIQLEQKPYPTSFVDGARSPEILTIPTAGVLSPTEGTVELWIYIDDVVKFKASDFRTFFHCPQGLFYRDGISIYYKKYDDTWCVKMMNGTVNASYAYLSAANMSPGWYYIAARWTSTELALFVNNQKGTIASNPYRPSSFFETASIGYWNGDNGTLVQYHASSLIDDLRISSIARSDEEIQQGYLSNKPLPVDKYTTYKLDFDNNLNYYSHYYDSSLNWNEPVYTSGNWESPVLDLGSVETLYNIYKFVAQIPSGGNVKVYSKYSEDNINWSEYEELTGVVVTARYCRFKIELLSPLPEYNIKIYDFKYEFYLNKESSIKDNFITLNCDLVDSATKDGGIKIERGASGADAILLWDESNDKWKAGTESSNYDIVLDNDSRLHIQNTDTGTSSQLFQIGGGVKLKNNSGILEVRNNGDSDYTDLIVKNLTVQGTTTIINSQTLQIGDNIITLNSDYVGSSPTENGGIEIERGTLTNASLIWDESNDKWKAGLLGLEKTIAFVEDGWQLSGNNIYYNVGNVGIGKTNPSEALDVSGNIKLSSQIISSLATGVAPLNVTSTTVCTNLNSDLLDGQHGTYYLTNRFGAETTGGVTDWNDVSNTRPGTGYTLLMGNAANGPGPAYYFHALNFEYSSKSGSGNVTQLAIPYGNQVDTGIFIRGRYNSNWTSWRKFWHDGNDGSGSGLDACLVDGVQGANLAKTNILTVDQLQNNTTLESGIYTNSGDGLKNQSGSYFKPSGTWWHIINMRHTHNNGYNAQIAVPLSTGGDDAVYYRTSLDGVWSAWGNITTGIRKISAGTVAPSNPSVNDLWIDTN